MSLGNSTTSRAARYRSLLSEAARSDSFSLQSLKLCLKEEQPSFITRTVRTLTRDGLLEQLSSVPQETYRWTARPDSSAIEAWIAGQVHGNQIKQGPPADRPRERLLALGASSLRTAELVAILVRTGRTGESALQAGEKIAGRFYQHLEKLPHAGRGALKALSPAIGDTAYCQIMAGIELGRRVAESSLKAQPSTRISDSNEAVAYCSSRFKRLAQEGAREEFHVVTLDTKNHVL